MPWTAQLNMATDEDKLCGLARPSPGNRQSPLTSVEEPAGGDRLGRGM